MDDLRKTMATVAASLQVLGANTTANTEALRQMTARNQETEQAVRELQGTFASIEVHMVKQFEQAAAHERDLDDLKRRVEILERRRPPAA